jgi:hypothetical protein
LTSHLSAPQTKTLQMPRFRGCIPFGTIPLALLLLVGLAPAGAAQSSVGTALEVEAFVGSDPGDTDPGGLAPGQVVANPGDEVTVQPKDGAQMRIVFNVETHVSLPAQVALVGPSGAELDVGLLCAEAASADHQSPAGFTCATGFTADPQNGTERWLYVGMHIAAGATLNIPAGVYSAEVVVTLAY